MILRWLIDATPVHRLATDHGLPRPAPTDTSRGAIDVVPDRAPTLEDVRTDQLHTGAPFVCLDGTLIHTHRCSTPSTSGNDAVKGYDIWHSGRAPPPRREHPGSHRPHRLPGLDQPRRTRLHTRHHRTPTIAEDLYYAAKHRLQPTR